MSLALDLDVSFTDTTIPKYHDDTIVDDYTKYVYDSLDAASWPSQAAPLPGDVWKDLTANGTNAAFYGADMPGFAGGFVFTESAVASPSGIAARTERLTLPAAAKIAATSKGFAVGTWLKHSGGTAGKQVAIAGWHSVLTGPWGIFKQDASFTLIGDSNTSNRPGITADVRHQFVIARVENGAGGFQVRYYVDGVLADTDVGNASVGQPGSPPANARIGYDAAAGLSTSTAATFNGRVYRHWLSDAGTVTGVFTAAYMDALVAKDWADNKDRAWT